MMGSATVYMPSFPCRKPLHVSVTSPTRKPSLYDVRTPVMTSRDLRNPRLLKRVVKEEELDDIVARLSRPTASSRMKCWKVKPKVLYVDMDYYQWNRLDVYADYQRQMYSSTGAIKPTFRKCGVQQAAVRRSYV